jgi:hypothetical protein
VDVKLAKVNAELSTYQQKLSKMRDGPGKNAIKQKALKVLQQRKLYENQKAQLQQQSWNMEQAGMMQDNLKNVMTTVGLDSFRHQGHGDKCRLQTRTCLEEMPLPTCPASIPGHPSTSSDVFLLGRRDEDDE